MTGFLLVPDQGSPQDDAFADALLRLAWYGAPVFERGARLHVRDEAAVRNALGRSLPHWASGQVQPLLARLGESLWTSPAPQNAGRIRWRAGRTGYDVPPLQPADGHDVHGDELADPAALQAWVDFGQRVSGCEVQGVSRLKGFPKGRVRLVGAGPTAHLIPTKGPVACNITVLSVLHENDPPPHSLPDLIISADSIALVGPSIGAAEMRTVLTTWLRKGARAVVRSDMAALLSWQLPVDCRDRIYGVPVDPAIRMGAALDRTDWKAPATSNVLTCLGLPLAAWLSDEIELAGFDGSVGASAGFEHVNRRETARLTLNLRAAHPLSGLGEAYHCDLRRDVALFRACLLEQGVRTWASGEKSLPTDAASDAPAPPIGRKVYVLAALADRHPSVPASAMAGLTAIASAVGMVFSNGMLLTYILIAMIVLMAAACTFGFFSLRRRQARMAADLQRDVSQQLGEVLKLVEASRHSRDDQAP